jgi:hypothetical protein
VTDSMQIYYCPRLTQAQIAMKDLQLSWGCSWYKCWREENNGAICSSLRGSGESEYPLVTTLGGMCEACNKAKAREQRLYRRAKCRKVAHWKAELGESGMRAIVRLRKTLRREVRCGYDH